MSFALCVWTDGRRHCISEAIPSLLANVHGPVAYRVIHDDSGDPDYRAWLQAEFPSFDLIGPTRRTGFSAAYGNAWRYLAQRPERFILGVEDDYTYNRPVDLPAMAELLDRQPYLAQVALRRQAVGHEVPHGGFMEMYPDWYVERIDGDMSWVETTRNFTTNPSLYRRELCGVGWPDREHSEGHFGFQLRDQGLPWGVPGDDVRFGFWAAKADAPWAHHIGEVRVGTGY